MFTLNGLDVCSQQFRLLQIEGLGGDRVKSVSMIYFNAIDQQNREAKIRYHTAIIYKLSVSSPDRTPPSNQKADVEVVGKLIFRFKSIATYSRRLFVSFAPKLASAAQI